MCLCVILCELFVSTIHLHGVPCSLLGLLWLVAMDEGSLLASIEAYNGQLQQVEAALAAGLDPEQKADLLQLKGDLQQLVELTESSLLSLRKSQLLASLEAEAEAGTPTESPEGHAVHSRPLANNLGTATGSQQGHTGPSEQDDEYASFYSELTRLGGTNPSSASAGETKQGTEGEEEEEEVEEEEVISSGSKIRAPYRTSWGTLEYHNAMVVGAETTGEEGEERVRVLYLYPTHRAMKPCPFYLEDKCRFQDNCR